ncbi:MAG: M56 family metallopeptidase [Gemmatimonadota bacterium]|nr:M56 family metallopeptidase [Gemmatimonadota bacterium]
MTGVLLQIGASKLLVSLALAALAWVVQRRSAHPAVTHPLWLLVLVTLLLPAVVAVPVLPGEGEMGAVVSGKANHAAQATARLPVGAAGVEEDAPGSLLPTRIAGNAEAGLATVWLAVAALLLGWTLVRTFRFRRRLARSSHPAPPQLVHEVAEIGRRLGLARMPEVLTTTARVSPMVCWTGGSIRLLIPSFLADGLGGRELRAVLAHELAHVRRRDHLVRWIEWLACSAFWWNPVAWWARRQMRAAEEASCDALAVAATESTPRAYAGSLLHVLEVMSRPPTPPAPAFASGVASGRNSISLQRRLRMLVKGSSTDPTPRWIRASVAGAAACLLPLGLVYCGQTTMTAPKEAPMEPPVDTVVVFVGPGGPDSLGAEPNEPWSGKREYAYWDLASSRMNRPRPLVDAPVYPEACRLDLEEPDEAARDEAMARCAVAMSNALGGTSGTSDRHICVVWRPTARRWRGICEGPEAEERHRLHGNDTGSVLLEKIVVVGSEG